MCPGMKYKSLMAASRSRWSPSSSSIRRRSPNRSSAGTSCWCWTTCRSTSDNRAPSLRFARRMIDGLGASDRLAIVNTGPFELIQQLSTDWRAAHALVRRFRGLKGSGPSPLEKTHLATTLLRVVRNVAKVPGARRPPRTPQHRRRQRGWSAGPRRTERRDYDYQPVLAAYDEMVGQAAVSNVASDAVDPRGLDAPMHSIRGATDRAVAQAAGQLGESSGNQPRSAAGASCGGWST